MLGSFLKHAFRNILVIGVIVFLLAACGQTGETLVPSIVADAGTYDGTEVTIDGTYIGRGGQSVLAFGVSTLDNGLDAQPIGDQIWLENFPEEEVRDFLHQPGDSVYGAVRVTGQFDADGAFGPDDQYQYQLDVIAVDPIAQVRRTETFVSDEALGDDKTTFATLTSDPAQYNGQSVTTRGYYFWNGLIFVLSEGISTEDSGRNPQPIGAKVWMEGFPPDVAGDLNVGPNNTYVWGLVEVTGDFQSEGNFGHEGAYTEFLQVTSAQAIEQ
ncbi:MAG: hypothetical protein AAGF95_02375 [Chloroflexota bacterium]